MEETTSTWRHISVQPKRDGPLSWRLSMVWYSDFQPVCHCTLVWLEGTPCMPRHTGMARSVGTLVWREGSAGVSLYTGVTWRDPRYAAAHWYDAKGPQVCRCTLMWREGTPGVPQHTGMTRRVRKCVAVHWCDAKGPKVCRGTLVWHEGSAGVSLYIGVTQRVRRCAVPKLHLLGPTE
jgi:hypothetical protein